MSPATETKHLIFEQEKQIVLSDLASKFLKNKYGNIVESFFEGTCQEKIININKGDWLGVEIEFCTTKETNDVSADLSRIPGVSVKNDSSIKPGARHNGVEVAVAFMKNLPGSLAFVCDYLESINAKINKSCGLHVHLDCRDVERSGAFARADKIKANIGFIKHFVESSRWYSQWCNISNPKEDWTDSRYHAVNYEAYNKFKTIEVRLHHGTTNFADIYNWCMLMYTLSRDTNTTYRNMDSFVAGMTDSVSKHFPVIDKERFKTYLLASQQKKKEVAVADAPAAQVPAAQVPAAADNSARVCPKCRSRRGVGTTACWNSECEDYTKPFPYQSCPLEVFSIYGFTDPEQIERMFPLSGVSAKQQNVAAALSRISGASQPQASQPQASQPQASQPQASLQARVCPKCRSRLPTVRAAQDRGVNPTCWNPECENSSKSLC